MNFLSTPTKKTTPDRKIRKQARKKNYKTNKEMKNK